MTPLQGLQGLYPDPQITGQKMDEGVAEAKANPLDPEHSQYGSQSYGYSGVTPDHSPFASFSIYDAGMIEPDYSGMAAPVMGEEIDRTPETHHAGWPRGIQQPSWANPDDYALVGQQMEALHGTDQGAVELNVGFSPSGRETPWHYSADRYDSPDDVVLAKTNPQQLRGTGSMSNTGRGSGGADVDQGFGVNNELPEFAHGHSMRYVQHDSAVFDYTNTHGQDEPFYGKHPIQQAQFNGPDSPYYEMGSIDGANIPWEGRIGDPAPYVQAPEPAYGPSLTSEDVWAYAG